MDWDRNLRPGEVRRLTGAILASVLVVTGVVGATVWLMTGSIGWTLGALGAECIALFLGVQVLFLVEGIRGTRRGRQDKKRNAHDGSTRPSE